MRGVGVLEHGVANLEIAHGSSASRLEGNPDIGPIDTVIHLNRPECRLTAVPLSREAQVLRGVSIEGGLGGAQFSPGHPAVAIAIDSHRKFGIANRELHRARDHMAIDSHG